MLSTPESTIKKKKSERRQRYKQSKQNLNSLLAKNKLSAKDIKDALTEALTMIDILQEENLKS